jgi:hypothetical protein
MGDDRLTHDHRAGTEASHRGSHGGQASHRSSQVEASGYLNTGAGSTRKDSLRHAADSSWDGSGSAYWGAESRSNVPSGRRSNTDDGLPSHRQSARQQGQRYAEEAHIAEPAETATPDFRHLSSPVAARGQQPAAPGKGASVEHLRRGLAREVGENTRRPHTSNAMHLSPDQVEALHKSGVLDAALQEPSNFARIAAEAALAEPEPRRDGLGSYDRDFLGPNAPEAKPGRLEFDRGLCATPPPSRVKLSRAAAMCIKVGVQKLDGVFQAALRRALRVRLRRWQVAALEALQAQADGHLARSHQASPDGASTAPSTARSSHQ